MTNPLTREDLELAAKALDCDIRWVAEHDEFIIDHGDHKGYSILLAPGWAYWNPLTDDGDALRLAVKLNLCVNVCEQEVGAALTMHGTCEASNCVFVFDDPYAATRLAITRAAIEIGKAMK